MSILIKGMEMPESCYYCPFADGVWQKNKRCLINGEEMPRDGRNVQQNHLTCPLIEVPPHGDLIDKDELEKKFCSHCDDYISGKDECKEGCFDLKIIKSMPTVIPADNQVGDA